MRNFIMKTALFRKWFFYKLFILWHRCQVIVVFCSKSINFKIKCRRNHKSDMKIAWIYKQIHSHDSSARSVLLHSRFESLQCSTVQQGKENLYSFLWHFSSFDKVKIKVCKHNWMALFLPCMSWYIELNLLLINFDPLHIRYENQIEVKARAKAKFGAKICCELI